MTTRSAGTGVTFVATAFRLLVSSTSLTTLMAGRRCRLRGVGVDDDVLPHGRR